MQRPFSRSLGCKASKQIPQQALIFCQQVEEIKLRDELSRKKKSSADRAG